ncbi:non-ribosomal peptide synthetase [Aquimarina mytili]|uniref:Amino acid adenylation domain-containing protein n=1 Tax=Aquimarina mytili TaxID=874423 RepID=A0A937A2Z4_9FLAO|nr:non-ribosomal peptide synthetase [Aquimarina mytili]MBL0685921.1 amino acid adenylation domain-containing protein [Aquimarina mytili]
MEQSKLNLKGINLFDINLLSEEEKNQYLYEFNKTNADFPGESSITALFEEQVDKTPDHIALQIADKHMTYKQLNDEANRFSAYLVDQYNVKPGDLVGIMLGRNYDLIPVILGILKAGAAYVPIDLNYPKERIERIITDSKISTLVIENENTFSVETDLSILNIYKEQKKINAQKVKKNKERKNTDLAYVIYTSGSTGNPKGVMIEDKSLINYAFWASNYYFQGKKGVMPLYSSISFDLTITSIFAPLISGNTIVIYKEDKATNLIEKIIEENLCDTIKLTPSHLKILKESVALKKQIEKGSNIRRLIVGGEELSTSLAASMYELFKGNIEIYNEYGPTEATVGCMIYKYNPKDKNLSVAIGGPINNTQIYILDDFLNPVANGMLGELYISGEGVARGYLSNEKLTLERFLENPFIPGTTMYKTGDFAQRLPDGSIIFSGRKDEQVKINAYRIELGEIENQLSKYKDIIDCTVAAKESNNEKYIVAYYTTKEEIKSSTLKIFLQEKLPEYMLPSYYMVVDKIPLTANGKLDKSALPFPDIVENREYIAPVSNTEKTLQKIWSEVLKLPEEEIGTTQNFLELGGHSIKMILMLNKVLKEFKVKVPMNEAFNRLEIQSLAKYIESLNKESAHNAINSALKKDFYPLSSAQKRLYFLHQFNSSSVTYNIPKIVRIIGKPNTSEIKNAFCELIDRYEILRTSFFMNGSDPVQKIHDDVDFELEYYTCKEDELNTTINEFVRPFNLQNPSLIRAGLVEISNKEYLLMVDMHHIITDGVSESILIKEFMALYDKQELPKLSIQYKDFVEWQLEEPQQLVLKKEKEYWLNEFKNKQSILNLPSDFIRPAVNTNEGAVVNFTFNQKKTNGLKRLAKQEETTLFVVLLSAFNILLSKLTNEEDVTIGSPVSGRQHSDLESVVGVFINMLALRNFPKANLGYTDFLSNVKSKVLQAFNNQGYPYEELIDELELGRDINHNPLFDVMFAYQNFENETFQISNLEVTPYELNRDVSRLDLSLQVFETTNELQLQFEYSTQLFKEETIERFISYFNEIIVEITSNPNIIISDIDPLPDKEKQKLLVEFNNTAIDFSEEDTVVSLFEKQALRSPDKIAIVYEGKTLTYKDVDEKSNQLAHYLKNSCQVGKNDIVGFMMDRSENLVIGLLGILKTGAAYLPIDPSYPKERISYVLKNSGANVLLVDDEIENEVVEDKEVVYLSQTAHEKKTSVDSNIKPDSVCYLIYTSGSTGNPKGVIITHQNVVNFIAGISDRIPATEKDAMLAVTSTSFDISVLELFWTICNGVEIVIHPSNVSLSGLDRYMPGEDLSMDFSLFFFSSYNNKETNKYDLLLESTKFADKSGFSAVWTPERHFHEFGGLYPNPSVISSALSMVTNQIELRSGSVVAPLHDPIRIVEEWSVVDNLSNGRVALSFASGWNPNDFSLAKDSYKERNKILHEQVDVMKKLWRGEPIKRENGLGKEVDLTVFPRPIQKEMPIWITSSGNIETFKSAGASGAHLLTHLLGQNVDELEEKIKLYRQARVENGYDENGGKVAVMLHAFIGEDIEEVERIVEEPFTEYLKTSIGLNKLLMEESGLNSDDIDGKEMKLVLKNAFKRYYKNSSLIGTKSKCSEMVLNLKKIGVDEIACLIDFGVENDKVLESLTHIEELKQLFAMKGNKAHQPITMMQSTPSFIKMTQEGGSSVKFLGSLKTLLLGGEPVPKMLVEQLQEKTSASIFNMYGPTETTVWSSIHKFSEEDSKVTVGTPIINTQILILDKNKKMVPVGVPGTLFIGGKGVSKGYWANEQLTNERFVQNPYKENDIIYDTGDIAKWNVDGTIELIGREDAQVKIRGHRIELGEIESQLNKHNLIQQSVVVCNNVEEEKYLAAFYVASEPLDVNDIRTYLFDYLPSYMQPSFFIQLNEMPLTPNGKIDKKALPNPLSIQEHDFVAPSNSEEEALVEIWSEVLELHANQISVEKSFFELGGNSLKILKLNSLMQEKLNWEVSIPEMFRYPSIASLIAYKNSSKPSGEDYGKVAEDEVSEMESMFNLIEQE